MVNQMKIGIVGFQGAIKEHIKALEQALQRKKENGEVIWLKNKSQLDVVDGVVIPGGESTTIGQLMKSSRIFEEVKKLGKEGLPIMGTCAGMILLAKEGGKEIEKTKQPLLGLMDISVTRNAFGRQKESFETDLTIKNFGEKPFPAVFIRAPAIQKTWGNAVTLATFKEKIVAAEQDNKICLAFHPELTKDTRAHEYFLEMVSKP